jgi:hypothetical protein
MNLRKMAGRSESAPPGIRGASPCSLGQRAGATARAGVLTFPWLVRVALRDPAAVPAEEAAARYLHRNVFLSRQV